MNKTIKYAVNGALIFGTINVLSSLVKQLNSCEEEKTIDWTKCFIALGRGVLIGSMGGFVIGTIRDNNMSKTLITVGGTVGFIKKSLEGYSDIDTTILPQKIKNIQSKINNEFGEDLSEYPSVSGSSKKGIAINTSDVDVQVKFNRNTESIKNIRGLLESYLNESFYDRNLIKVRSQNYSIGLIYDIKGEEKRIDIVPMREVGNGKGDTYLYSIKNDSIKKTNTKKQLEKLKLSEKQKHIIKLLKGWKVDNNLKFPSVFLEHIVNRAFKEKVVPYRIDKALFFLIEYIANNITQIKIVDPANTNNIISEVLSYNDKIYLKDFCNKMLNEIDKDERNIIDYFKCTSQIT